MGIVFKKVGFVTSEGVEELVEALATGKPYDLTVDLSEVRWIDAYSYAVLYKLSCIAIAAGGGVEFKLPKAPSAALAFFAHSRFASALKNVGVRGNLNLPLVHHDESRICIFETFERPSDYAIFENALFRHGGVTATTRADNVPLLMTRREFGSVLLHELFDNVFSHALGQRPLCVIQDIGSSAKRPRSRSLVERFEGGAYLEIVVSDCGQHSIIDTLQSSIPTDYDLSAHVRKQGSLDRSDQTIIHAFDYGSSSNPTRREAALKEYVSFLLTDREDGTVVWPELARRVQTGLHAVKNIVAAYRGEILVRANRRFTKLSFAEGGAKKPTATSWKLGASRRPGFLVGTTIWIRVPLQTRAGVVVAQPQVATRRPLPSRDGQRGRPDSRPSVSTLVSPPVLANGQPDLEAVLTKVEHSFRSALNEATVGKLIVLNLAGVEFQSRAFGALLEILANLPKELAGLLVVVGEDIYVDWTSDQWRQVQARQGPVAIASTPSMIVARSAARLGHYGTVGLHGSARVKNDQVVSESATFGSVGSLLHQSAIHAAACFLTSEYILHKTSKLYLIQRRYYTSRFYEVTRTLKSAYGMRILEEVLANVIDEMQATAVCYYPPFVSEMLSNIHKRRGIKTWEEIRLSRRTMRTDILKLKLWEKEEGRSILFVTDVVCTGEIVTEFCRLYGDMERVEVFVFVDCRGEDAPENWFEIHQGLIRAKLRRVVRDPLVPLKDRPEGFNEEDITDVDPLTNSPVKDILERGDPEDERLRFGRLAGANAILRGHFEKAGRHFPYFIAFDSLFQNAGDQVTAWLRSQKYDMRKTTGFPVEDVEVACLDQNSGLIDLVRLAVDGEEWFNHLRELDVDEITRPREHERMRRGMWFVIPGMASGITVQRCLEYAHQRQCGYAWLSVIYGRIDDTVHAFYKNVRQYAELRCRIDFMLAAPLRGYKTEECPLCRFRKHLQDIRGSVGGAQHRLCAALDMVCEELEPVRAWMDQWGAQRGIQIDPERVAREAQLVAELERGPASRLRRQDLTHKLRDSVESVVGLAAGVGHMRLERGDIAGVEYAIYDPGVLERGVDYWVHKPHQHAAEFHRELKGLAALAPAALERRLFDLGRSIVDTPSLFERFCIEATQSPDFFLDTLIRLADAGPKATGELRSATLSYIFKNQERSDAAAITSLNELRVMLTESHNWPQELNHVASALTVPPDMRLVKRRFERFRRSGYEQVEQQMRRLREQGELWHQLQRSGIRISDRWHHMTDCVRRLDEAVHDLVPERDALQMSLDQIRNSTMRFVKEIDKVAIDRQIIRREVERYRVEFAPNRVVRLEFADDFDNCALSVEDFRSVIDSLLENALEYTSENAETIFRFEMEERDPQLSKLSLLQTEPWRSNMSTSGGLERIRRVLRPYGGTLRRTGSDQPPGPFLEIRLLGWPLEPQR